MPVYNCADYIGNTFANLQSFFLGYEDQIELICIDDGSEDSTVQVINSLKKQNNLHYLKLIENDHFGVSASRNLGISIASGKYISMIDSDDDYQIGFLAEFVDQLKVYNYPDFILEDVKGIPGNKYINNAGNNELVNLLKILYRIGPVQGETGVASKFIKSSVIRDNGIVYNDQLNISEDVLFNVDCILKCKSYLVSNANFYNVKPSHSMSYFHKDNLNSQIVYLRELEDKLEHLNNTNDIIDLAYEKALNIIIERYFGPLYMNGVFNLKEVSNNLKRVIIDHSFMEHLKNSNIEDVPANDGLRYKVFRILIKNNLFKLAILFDKYLDKVKGYNRFK